MRPILTVIVAILAIGCTERISTSDINKLIDNQLENNQTEIDRIKKDIVEFKIEKYDGNKILLNNLDQLHAGIVRLNDSIDFIDNESAVTKSGAFIDKHFANLKTFNETPLEINSSTPKPLIKLHLSKLEAFLIREQRFQYDYGDTNYAVSFDSLKIQIIPTKAVVAKGEPISGKLVLVGIAHFENSNHPIKQMTINGQKIIESKDGWQFKITPHVQGKGIIPYELSSEAMLHGAHITGKQTIYIQNE